MAIETAQELNITPWEALLLSVRRQAGRVKWADQRLIEAQERNGDGPAGREVKYWIKESRHEANLLAQVSKSAVDSGIADRLVRQVELEGNLVATAIAAALDRLDLTPEERALALTTANERLLEPGDTIEG